MQPQAATDRFEVRGDGELVVLVDRESGVEHHLDPVAGAVWRHADGAHDVQELAAIVARELDALVSEPEVWAALDALGDAGLLEGRTAPPADSSMSRRFLLRTAAVTGALFVGTAGAAVAADDKSKGAPGKDDRKDNDELGRWRAAAEQSQKGEQGAKSQESRSKDSLASLGAREQTSKAQESDVKGSFATLGSREDASKSQESGAKAQENAAKGSAESSEKLSNEELLQLRRAQEDGAKQSARLSAVERELADLRAQEARGKDEIGREQEGKSSFEASSKSSAEQAGKSSAEQSSKSSAEQAGKSSAEQSSKSSAESAGKSSAEASSKAPGGGAPPTATPPPSAP